MMVSADIDPRRAGTIWMVNLDEPAPVVTTLVQAVFRRVGPDRLTGLASSMSSNTEQEIAARFKSGGRCYVAWVGEVIAAYGWVSFNEETMGEMNLHLKFAAGEAYIWDCVTLPGFRQKRLYSALLSYILKELHSENLCRAWIGADRNNTISQLGIARAGFQHVADLEVHRVLTLRQVWVSGYPDVPTNIVAEARRIFLNDRDEVWLKVASHRSKNLSENLA